MSLYCRARASRDILHWVWFHRQPPSVGDILKEAKLPSMAEAFAKALEQAFVMPASSIPAPPKVHPMEPESAEPREGQPMPLEPEQAGLEFASGVHLIEEMENQVKQWEESEGTREVAYNAWVQQQMMRAVSMGSRPPSS